MRRLLPRVGLSALLFLLALLAAEIVVRVFFPLPAAHDCVLLVDDRWLAGGPDGGVHFVPDRAVREVVVCDGRVEYDIRYPVDDRGRVGVAPPDDASDGPRVAFVGDSFTAGSGYGDWVGELAERLRAERPGLRTYNLGVPGAGFPNFHARLRRLSTEITPSHVLFLVVSDDFARGPWRPLVRDQEIRFCDQAPAACLERPPTAYIVPRDSSTEEYLERAKAAVAAGRGREPAGGSSRSALLRRLRLLSGRWSGGPDDAERDYGERLRETARRNLPLALGSIADVQRMQPAAEVVFVHLPQLEEVARDQYHLDIASEVAGLGIPYVPALHVCDWSADMFHEADGHPNARGYRAIADCIHEHVFATR